MIQHIGLAFSLDRENIPATKLKILWLNWKDLGNPEAGGAEVFTHEVAKRWVRNGHEVTLFSSEFPFCQKEEVMDGVRIFRAGGKYSVYRKAKLYYMRVFSKEGYDIVIDEINTMPFLTSNFMGNRGRIIALIHQLAREYWFYEMPFPISYIGYYILENRWLSNYISIPTVTVSESTKRDLIDLGFKSIHVVSEGLNFKPLDQVPEKEGRPIVAYVGRLKRAKRPDHAIKAFKVVKEKIPDAELWIIGDGYFKKKLEKLTCVGVRFLADLSNEERRKLLRKAWVMVNPSVREGFGLNVIEANALGVPCVAYNVPGLRDSVQNGETGLLVNSGDVKDLAKCLIQLIENEELRVELSKKALEYSRKFDWEKTAEEFFNVLRMKRNG